MAGARVSPLCIAVGLVIIGVLAPTRSDADVLAQSTFGIDADGWVVKDLAYPNPGAPPNALGTYAPTYHSSGGNPGGDISMADPTGNTWYWFAPSKFLGNKQVA